MRNLIITAVLLCLALPAFAADSAKESAFDRVMRTNTLHCGYGVWAPNIIQDPNSGKLSGIFYDYLNALAAAANIKVEWKEVSWSDFAVELNSQRIDAMCAGIWPTAAKAREMVFTTPVNYVAINAYVRANDNRFDGASDKLNASSFTIATMDAEISSIVAHADFPNAKTLEIPSSGSQPQMLLNVATGKADVTFSDVATGAEFMARNPGRIKILPGGAFIRTFGNTIALGKNETALRDFLNTGTEELLQSGTIAKILAKYEKYPGSLLPVSKPYEIVK